MTKVHKKIIKITFASFLVGVLIFTVNWQEVFFYIKNVDKFFLALFVLFYVCGIFISARKWQILAYFTKFIKPYFFYVKTYVLGTFLNNFFPSFVGGDTYRTIALGKEEKRIKESSATVVVDRITGLVAIIFLAAIFGFMNYSVLQDTEFIWISIIGLMIIFCGFVIIIIIIIFHSQCVQKLLTFLPQFVQKYISILVKFRSHSIAARSFLYSILFSFVGIAIANYMLFIAVDVYIAPMDYISVIFLTNLIASLPLSIGNIGTKEWAYILLFGIFGIGSGPLVAIVLLSRVLQMLVSLVALPLYISEKESLK